jgi:hypothetical protein
VTREIKFRGRRFDNGEWVYGSLICRNSTRSIVSHDLMIHPGWQEFDVDPETVGQCTGLIDKNDREVYEGDIIDTTIKARPIMVVVWDEGALTWGLVDPTSGHRAGDGYLDATMDYVEVIGNIYENPELLSQEAVNDLDASDSVAATSLSNPPTNPPEGDKRINE